ncbi:hypothetical protein C8J57DRAFT_1527321 [Mycena rebaudengoi]|nr:hypothetical protein C8J57DRAFT_1527321 [Mycena rebaudengoi]
MTIGNNVAMIRRQARCIFCPREGCNFQHHLRTSLQMHMRDVHQEAATFTSYDNPPIPPLTQTGPHRLAQHFVPSKPYDCQPTPSRRIMMGSQQPPPLPPLSVHVSDADIRPSLAPTPMQTAPRGSSPAPVQAPLPDAEMLYAGQGASPDAEMPDVGAVAPSDEMAQPTKPRSSLHMILPSAAVVHAHQEHNLPLLPAAERPKLAALCKQYSTLEDLANIPIRLGLAPVQGLRTDHKAKCPGGPVFNEGAQQGAIQSFSHLGNQRWFEVEPSIEGLTPEHPFAVYLRQFGKRFDDGFTILPPPVIAGQNSPINQITYWDKYLDHWTGDNQSLTNIRLLMDMRPSAASAERKGLWHLHNVSERYQDRIHAMSKTLTQNHRKQLISYPRIEQGGKSWKAHENRTTRTQYGAQLHAFIHAVLLSLDPATSTDYKFPLSSFERLKAKEYRTVLETEKPEDKAQAEFLNRQVLQFHEFACLLLLRREAPNIPLATDAGKFDCILKCLCSVWCLGEDGLMSSATETTPVFARLEYLIRGTLVFEAVKRRSEFNDDLSLYVGSINLERDLMALTRQCSSLNALADIHLAPGVPSPYQMVVDYQTPISSIAYNSTLPPNTRVSADGQTISYKDKNLYFPRYKQGIHNGIAKCTKRLEKLMYGMSIPVDMPARPEDDWAEERRGYSFLDLHTYVAGNRPWLKGLLSNPELGLLKLKPDGGVLVDSNGRPLFNQKALHEVLKREAKFIDVFMPTVYMASSSNRGTQFAEAKIRNSTRGRNVFIDTDGNIWLVTHCPKEETRTMQETFVPIYLGLSSAGKMVAVRSGLKSVQPPSFLQSVQPPACPQN